MPIPSKHKQPTTAAVARATTAAAVAALATLNALPLAGCDNLQAARGASSVFALVPATTPEDAVELALDPYNPDRRYRGITELADADFGGADVYLRLYEDAVVDEDAGVRQAGIRALGLHGTPEHAELIAPALADTDAAVRTQAGMALQRLHNPTVIPELRAAVDLESEIEPSVRAAAAHALGQYRTPLVFQTLVKSLADPSLTVNAATVESLEVLTGQNFGLDSAAWLDWFRDTRAPFLAGRVYAYPGFERDRWLIEYLPFMSGPPNEPDGAPVGLPRDGG